jgi:DNA-directed RNA polymerase specialized sigma24 family protein
VDGPEALCAVEGEALRRALTVAFGDETLASRCTAAAFARARRRWRAVSSLPDPMVWIDVTAVRYAHRRLARLERRPAAERTIDDPLAALSSHARVAVVLHAHRGRSVDDIAEALATSRPEAETLLRDSYRSLGVGDVLIEEDTVPYAG